MPSVQIVGWREGFRQSAMTRTLRRHLGLGLAAARAIADQVLDGAAVTLEVPDESVARVLVQELTALGAIATLGGPDRVV